MSLSMHNDIISMQNDIIWGFPPDGDSHLDTNNYVVNTLDVVLMTT